MNNDKDPIERIKKTFGRMRKGLRQGQEGLTMGDEKVIFAVESDPDVVEFLKTSLSELKLDFSNVPSMEQVAKAVASVTDPPYNIDYGNIKHNYVWGHPGKDVLGCAPPRKFILRLKDAKWINEISEVMKNQEVCILKPYGENLRVESVGEEDKDGCFEVVLVESSLKKRIKAKREK